MAFAPSDYIGPQSSAMRRTVIFWLFMLVLGALLWKMASWQVGNELNYSDFVQQIEKNNVASAKLFMGQNTGRVRGTLREPAKLYNATVRKEVIPDLTELLRKHGISVTASEAKGSLVSTILNFVPLVLLIFLWILKMRKTGVRQHTKL